MGVKNLSLSYSVSNGTILPGFLPTTKFFGNNVSGGTMAPGLPFVLGIQDNDFAVKAAKNGWITTDPTLNSPYVMNSQESYNFRSSIQPLSGMRIDITANRTLTKNATAFYLADSLGNFSENSRKESGNFTMTVGTWGTAFEKLGDDNSSATFNTFKNNRITIANRLRDLRYGQDGYTNEVDPETGFPLGYGPTSQEVLIPAFLAAYQGSNPEKISLETFPQIVTFEPKLKINMIPNWRLTWDGLSKVEWLKKYFTTISVGHTYRSTYSIGSYNTNLDYLENADGYSITQDILDNWRPEQDINSVSINEQFSPLINIDVTWNNSLTTKVELKKSRNLTLSFSNQQLTEVRSQEYVVGAGYRISDLEIFVGTRKFKSDLTIRLDFSLRENWTILRQINDDNPQVTSGSRILSIKSNADYVLSDRFSLRFFIDYSSDKPRVSLSFPRSTTSIGFSVRFQLAG